MVRGPRIPTRGFAQEALFTRRSSLETSPFFSPAAVSQQDFITTYSDTLATLPGTSTRGARPRFGQLRPLLENNCAPCYTFQQPQYTRSSAADQTAASGL